jgi:hypothetical protein
VVLPRTRGFTSIIVADVALQVGCPRTRGFTGRTSECGPSLSKEDRVAVEVIVFVDPQTGEARGLFFVHLCKLYQYTADSLAHPSALTPMCETGRATRHAMTQSYARTALRETGRATGRTAICGRILMVVRA